MHSHPYTWGGCFPREVPKFLGLCLEIPFLLGLPLTSVSLRRTLDASSFSQLLCLTCFDVSSLNKEPLDMEGYCPDCVWECCYFKQPKQCFCCSWAAFAQVFAWEPRGKFHLLFYQPYLLLSWSQSSDKCFLLLYLCIYLSVWPEEMGNTVGI